MSISAHLHRKGYLAILITVSLGCKPKESKVAKISNEFQELNINPSVFSKIEWSKEHEAISLMRRISTDLGAKEAALIGKLQGQFNPKSDKFDPRWSTLHGFVPPPNVSDYMAILKKTHEKLEPLDKDGWVFAGCTPKDALGILDFKDYMFWIEYPRTVSQEDLKRCGELVNNPPDSPTQMEFMVVPWRTQKGDIVLRQAITVSKDVIHNPGLYLGPFLDDQALTLIRPDSWKEDLIIQVACTSANPQSKCSEGWKTAGAQIAQNLGINDQNIVNMADLALRWYKSQRSKTYSYLGLKALSIFSIIVSVKQFQKGMQLIRISKMNDFGYFSKFKNTNILSSDGIDIPPYVNQKFEKSIKNMASKVALTFGFLNIAGATITGAAALADLAGVERTIQLLHPDDSQLLSFAYSNLQNLAFYWGFWDLFLNNPKVLFLILKGAIDLRIMGLLTREILTDLADTQKAAAKIYEEILSNIAASSAVSVRLIEEGGTQIVQETAETMGQVLKGGLHPTEAFKKFEKHGKKVREIIQKTCTNLSSVGVCARENIQKSVVAPSLETIQRIISSPAYYAQLTKNALKMSEDILVKTQFREIFSRSIRTAHLGANNDKERKNLLSWLNGIAEHVYVYILSRFINMWLVGPSQEDLQAIQGTTP